jgi:hypothetical protein
MQTEKKTATATRNNKQKTNSNLFYLSPAKKRPAREKKIAPRRLLLLARLAAAKYHHTLHLWPFNRPISCCRRRRPAGSQQASPAAELLLLQPTDGVDRGSIAAAASRGGRRVRVTDPTTKALHQCGPLWVVKGDSCIQSGRSAVQSRSIKACRRDGTTKQQLDHHVEPVETAAAAAANSPSRTKRAGGHR